MKLKEFLDQLGAEPDDNTSLDYDVLIDEGDGLSFETIENVEFDHNNERIIIKMEI